MSNSKSKYGRVLYKLGNGLASLVSTNVAWLIICIPAFIFAIVSFSSSDFMLQPMNLILLALLFSVFVIPAYSAVFQILIERSSTKEGWLFKKTVKQFFDNLKKIKPNFFFGIFLTFEIVMILVNKNNVALTTFLITIGIVILGILFVYSVSCSNYVNKNWQQIMVEHPFKMIVEAILIILALMINTNLFLSFFLLLFSASLPGLVGIFMFKDCIVDRN
ncbi:MAG TPA: hypothetical protein H9803_00030 [Candidatus Ligilactobacillus excrementavium]|nr:hypothetical protein [Candidatus Ligilactobacillus excrementavium]